MLPTSMKKEVILAIVIGFGIGLLITFGIYTARTALERKTAASPSPTPEFSPEASASSHQITITEPKPDTLTDTDKVTVTGSTTPESAVTLITAETQKIVVADKTGRFSAELELTGGINEISVTSFAPDGAKSQVTITIVYSTAEI